MNQHEFYTLLSHADVLLSQNRYEQADHILSRLLATGYEGTELYKMVIVCRVGQNRYEEAEEMCRMLLSRHPDDPFLFYIMATISNVGRDYHQALKYLDEAILMDPANDAFFAFKAQIQLQMKDYQISQKTAEVALELNAENTDALNVRAASLIGQGRKTEAFETINKSLATDPENPDTHANMGWGLLHHGETNQALEHFKQALKFNPMHDHAKYGMSEAMKSKFPVYRYFLQLMLWLGKMKSGNQWAIIIGGYIIYRVLIKTAENVESLQPFLIPLIGLMLLFFLSTWIFSPLMNLYLLTNPYGRYTLDNDQKQSAKLVGIALSIALLFLTLSVLLPDNDSFLSCAILSFAMMIPLGSMNNPDLQQNKKKLRYFTAAIAVVVLLYTVLAFISPTSFSGLFMIPLLLLVGYQWYANYVMLRAE
jgi:tetratricopeptide (TPR) repeat protein